LNNPPIDQLLNKADSKYTLIIIASKRARQITEKEPELLQGGIINPVSLALKELNEDRILWKRTKDGIK